MKWLWKKHKPGEKGKKTVILPKELASCVDRILTEKKRQCEFNNVPFEGMTLEEISKEVCSRLGNEWTVSESKRSGLKL